MSEETEVPIVCDDCGGNLTNAGDDLFSMALGEDRPHYWHMEQCGCIASLNERLTAATQRAEAAEARRDVWELRARKVVQERRALRVECEALRKYLLDLLAVVHRDGGHHTEAVGTRQSVVDAELAVHALRKDAARLDWMESERVLRASFYPLCFPPCWVVEASEVTSGETLRVAIDAALAGQPTTGEGV